MDSDIVEQPQAEEAKVANESEAKPEDQAEHGEQAEQGEKSDDKADEAKPAKTPEQKELEKARRRIDKLTRRLHEQSAQYAKPTQREYHSPDDDEPITLTRAELQAKIQEEAIKVAPVVKEQEAVLEHRKAVIAALDKDFGTEKFNEIAADLDEALGGLADRNGHPKPVADAIFESENPRALIEYLADPDHEDEAKAIGRMSATQAARAIVKIEAKLSDKPKSSKAAEPLAPVKAAASGKKSIFDMSDKEFFEQRRNFGKRK